MTVVNVESIQPTVTVQKPSNTIAVTSAGGRGLDGKTAYQVAVDNGFIGDEAAWLASLEGISAYEVAVNNGFVGTEAEWVASLEGATAYEVAVAAGFVGDENAWLATLEGLSAYEVAVNNGFVGDETAWLDSLNGADGVGIPVGGTAGQVLEKTDGTDYNVQWADPVSGLPLASDKDFVVYSTNNVAKGALVDNGPLTITCNNTTWGSPNDLKVQDGVTHKVGGIGNWVMFDFGSAVTLYSWVMTGHSSKYITSLRWEYSDDGVNFTALETFSGLGVGPYERSFADREQSHRWWRYVLLAGANGGEGEVDYVGFYVSDISGEWMSKTPSEALGLLIPGGTIGQVLEKQSATDGDATWVDPTTPPSALDDLTDVNAPTPSTGQALVWSGTEWAPSDVAAGGGSNFAEDIGEVTANTPVTVTHNLGTMDVIVEVFEKDAAGTGAAAGSIVEPQVTLVDTNSLELTFAENAVANLYRVVISSGGGGGTVESASFLHGRRIASDQSTTSNVTTTAIFDTVSSSFGTDLSLNTSTGEVTVSRSGVYVISAAIEATTTTLDARVWVYVDGSPAFALARRRLMEVYRDFGGTVSLYLNEGSIVTFAVNIYGNSSIRAGASYFTISGPMYGGGSSGGSTDMTAVRQFTFLMMGA